MSYFAGRDRQKWHWNVHGSRIKVTADRQIDSSLVNLDLDTFLLMLILVHHASGLHQASGLRLQGTTARILLFESKMTVSSKFAEWGIICHLVKRLHFPPPRFPRPFVGNRLGLLSIYLSFWVQTAPLRECDCVVT